MIESLRPLVREALDDVQNLIMESIESDVSLLHDVAGHLLNTQGKQFRPILLLLSANACGYKGRDHIKLAAMVELFHAATLLHDDVVDDSSLRRGKQTAHEIWGNKTSILVGDYLFSQYMQLMIRVGNLHIMDVLTKMTLQVGEGELKQLANRHNPALDMPTYFEIIQAKTALLFAASSRLGAMIAQPNTPNGELELAFHHFGLHVGNGFQLIDDALDYCASSDTLGKNIGDDLADGKATMPLIYAYQNSTHSQQIIIQNALKEGSLNHLDDIMAAIDETSAIEHTRHLAQKEIDAAKGYLDKLEDSIYKQALYQLADSAILRPS